MSATYQQYPVSCIMLPRVFNNTSNSIAITELERPVKTLSKLKKALKAGFQSSGIRATLSAGVRIEIVEVEHVVSHNIGLMINVVHHGQKEESDAALLRNKNSIDSAKSCLYSAVSLRSSNNLGLFDNIKPVNDDVTKLFCDSFDSKFRDRIDLELIDPNTGILSSLTRIKPIVRNQAGVTSAPSFEDVGTISKISDTSITFKPLQGGEFAIEFTDEIHGPQLSLLRLCKSLIRIRIARASHASTSNHKSLYYLEALLAVSETDYQAFLASLEESIKKLLTISHPITSDVFLR